MKQSQQIQKGTMEESIKKSIAADKANERMLLNKIYKIAYNKTTKIKNMNKTMKEQRIYR